MHVRFAALAAAALTLAPAAVRAQQGVTTLGQYTVRGCLDGTVRYEQQPSMPVRGRVACFGGFADLQLLVTPSPDGPVPNVRFAPTITAEFGPEFAGTGAFPVGASFSFAYATGGGATLRGRTQTLGGPLGAWTVGSPAPATFTTAFDPLLRDALLTSIGDVSGLLQIRYSLPGSPGGTSESTQLSLTLTPVPEPSTFALAGAGLLAFGAAARRRRA
jgi:hypothetical protein